MIIVFWFYVVQLVRKDGFKIPLLAAVFWIAGYFAFPAIGLEGGLYFSSYGAILSLFLIILDMSREKMGLRWPRTNPLTEDLESKSNTL